MHISKFVFALLIAGTALEFVQAQVMTPAEQQKAVELLRRKMAEERGKGATSKPAATPAKVVTPARSTEFQPPKEEKPKQETPKVAAKPAATAAQPSASTESHKSRTLWDGLKNAFSRKGGSGSGSVKAASSSTAPKESKETKAPKTQPSAQKSEEKPVAPVVQPIAVPTAPPTKQQRLTELIELYRTDKIGPIEYHERRAKILAEP